MTARKKNYCCVCKRKVDTFEGEPLYYYACCNCKESVGRSEMEALSKWHRWHNGVLARAKKVMEERAND